jgi:CubicO group peptidase (beta-lactamase class C family)
VWSEAFGQADRAAGVEATPATLFGIGSFTKSLTMALGARLVDQGRLDLDAPVERYLPGCLHAGRGVTTRLVAAHLSGLGDDFASANRTGRRFGARAGRWPSGRGAWTLPRWRRTESWPRAASVYVVLPAPFTGDAVLHLVAR